MSEELIKLCKQDIEICRAVGNKLREKRMKEIIRRLKALDKVISKLYDVKHTDMCLFGTRVKEVLRKENLLEYYEAKEEEGC